MKLLRRSPDTELARENELLREKLEEAEATIRAIRTGEIDALVVQDQEKTQVRHLVAEEILAQSILEQVADAVIICDERGNVIRASRAVKRIYGTDPTGKRFDEVFDLRRTDHENRDVITFEALLFNDNLRGFEVSSREGADEFFLLLSVGVLRDGEDTLGAVVTLTDITDRKRSEALLRQADRRKDEFLATLAHELRNPLAPLHNALNVLSHARGDARIFTQVHETMTRQMKQMVRLVDDLLDVSRITRNNIELRQEASEFDFIMKSALETSRPLIEGKKHSVTTTLPKDAVYLNADIVRMTQVFSNLLNNAAKYTPEGGRIDVEAKVRGDSLAVSIRDNGIGIEPKMLPHVFDMFAQADSSIERSQGGLGIGLTLVKSLVQLHGGSIEAKSEGLGKGSEFTVTLPVSAKAPVRLIEEHAESASAGLNILVVDDNEPSARTLGWMLEIMGHKPTLLCEGSKVLEMAEKLRPDAILLDIGLPGVSGYDICRTLRSRPEFDKTILIAQTGWGQEQHRQMAKDAGFNHHLVKPVDSSALEKILHEKSARDRDAQPVA